MNTHIHTHILYDTYTLIYKNIRTRNICVHTCVRALYSVLEERRRRKREREGGGVLYREKFALYSSPTY